MRYTIDESPSYSVLELTLGRGEEVVSESGALAWRDPGITMRTNTRGGIFRGLKKDRLNHASQSASGF